MSYTTAQQGTGRACSKWGSLLSALTPQKVEMNNNALQMKQILSPRWSSTITIARKSSSSGTSTLDQSLPPVTRQCFSEPIYNWWRLQKLIWWDLNLKSWDEDSNSKRLWEQLWKRGCQTEMKEKSFHHEEWLMGFPKRLHCFSLCWLARFD